MNASKENALKAFRLASDIESRARNELTPHMIDERLKFICAFLDAAERKLPTEAAFKRDQQRRKSKAAFAAGKRAV